MHTRHICMTLSIACPCRLTLDVELVGKPHLGVRRSCNREAWPGASTVKLESCQQKPINQKLVGTPDLMMYGVRNGHRYSCLPELRVHSIKKSSKTQTKPCMHGNGQGVELGSGSKSKRLAGPVPVSSGCGINLTDGKAPLALPERHTGGRRRVCTAA